jgi:hypothetical protein
MLTIGKGKRKITTPYGRAKNCYSGILSLDLFARQVNLTFQGRDKYHTAVGTLFTVIFVVLLAGYGFFRFEPIINDSKTELSKFSLLISEGN